jgi:hypothetical protein
MDVMSVSIVSTLYKNASETECRPRALVRDKFKAEQP